MVVADNRILKVLSELAEIPLSEPVNPNPVEVKESAHGGSLEEEDVFGAEDEV